MNYLERAEALFERFVGFRIRVDTYTETLRYDKKRGARLSKDKVIGISSVRAKAVDWDYSSFFGSTDWIDIDVANVTTNEKNGHVYVTLPPTLFGTTYTEVSVTYDSGFEEMPRDMSEAIQEISRLLQSGQITEWNCILPASVHDVISTYRKEEID